MVIRRIREHVAAHNWFAVAIDLAIVVLGVFIATQVNNWNESRIEAEQSRSYRARLISELDFNARQYRQQIDYYQQVREHGLAALAALEGRTDPSPRDFLIHAYQASQIDSTPAKTYIYNEMVSAGLVDRLGDEALQELASDYYLSIESNNRSFQEIFPYRTIIRRVMPYALQEPIRSQCGDIFLLYRQRVTGVRLPDRCTVVLDPAKAAAGAQIIRKEPNLAVELTRYLASTDEKLFVLTEDLRLTANFKRRLVEAERRG